MDSDPKTFIVPDELCRRAGIAAVWNSTNEIGVFPYHHEGTIAPEQDKVSPFAVGDGKVFQVRQEIILFKPILRKLVNEANGSFLNVQHLMTLNNVDHKTELVKFSHQYRSIVRACLENLQEEAAKVKGVELEETQNYITIFYSVECIWHLCEILFVDEIPGDIVLPKLLEWIRFHFPKFDRNAATMLTSELEDLSSNALYWETVYGSLLQGRIDVVRALLRLHSNGNSETFRLVDETLKSMPVYSIFGGSSVTEFNLQRQQWVVDTKAKIDAKLFVSEEKLNLIMLLSVGDEAAWSKIQNYCETWYELLAGWLFFSEPTVKTYELGRFAKRCLAKSGARNRMKHLDTVLLAAMEADILQVIKEIQYLTENGWFVTHLTDLLYHSGCLDKLEKESDTLNASKLRESFALDYGTLLMGHHSLWQVGLSYLDCCPTHGLYAIELLLQRLPLGSEARTHKIIKEAQKRNLPHIVQTICKVQGMKSLKQDRLGNALSWSMRSQDSLFAAYLAEQFLRQYCKSGELHNTDLLDNLGSCILLSDRLAFLGKYCEFHKLYQNREYKQAAQVLISLLASKLTPEYFWSTLLLDALPLLECDDLVFSSNDVYTLIHYLDERENEKDMENKIDLIRIAAARNLAKALTYEAQVSF